MKYLIALVILAGVAAPMFGAPVKHKKKSIRPFNYPKPYSVQPRQPLPESEIVLPPKPTKPLPEPSLTQPKTELKNVPEPISIKPIQPLPLPEPCKMSFLVGLVSGNNIGFNIGGSVDLDLNTYGQIRNTLVFSSFSSKHKNTRQIIQLGSDWVYNLDFPERSYSIMGANVTNIKYNCNKQTLGLKVGGGYNFSKFSLEGTYNVLVSHNDLNWFSLNLATKF